MRPERILLLKHGAFGDLLQAEGILRGIRGSFAAAHISLLTAPAFQSLMQRCPHLDAVMADPRSAAWCLAALRRLRASLQAGGFDLVIDLQNSRRTRLYRRLLLPAVPWIQRPAGASAPVSGLQGLIDLLQPQGIDVTAARTPSLSWMAEDMRPWLAKKDITPGYVLLLPGCSARRPEKRWPYFPELARSLQQRGTRVVTVLGPDERELAPHFDGAVLSGLDWFQLAGVIDGAGFVIGNDSGPSHLAAHLGKPGVALFGPYSSAARAEIEREAFKPHSTDALPGFSVQAMLTYLRDRGALVSCPVGHAQRPADTEPYERGHPVVQKADAAD